MPDAVLRWLIVAVALAACAPQPEIARGDASTPGPTPAPSASASERPRATPVPEATADPDVLAITCTADGGTQFPSGTTVSAQSDGVQIIVDNRSGEYASVGPVDVPAGVSRHVLTLAPGSHDLACWPFSRHEDEQPKKAPAIVTDPQRHWVSTEVQCEGGMVQHQVNDYAYGASGEQGDPVDLARKRAGADLRDASFRRGGYPESSATTVIAQRDGRTVAVFGFSGTPEKGWLLHGIERC